MKRLVLLACSALMAQPPAYRLPPVFATKLPNGLTVMLVDDQRWPLATVRLAFRCGSRCDPIDLPGVAEAVAELLPQATKTRGAIRIGEAVNTMGGSLTTASGPDYLAIDGSIVADNLAPLIEIMADIASNAELSDIDLRLYRQNRKQNLARQYAQPGFIAKQTLRTALFGDHPYAHIGPTAASLDRLSRQALIDYRDKWLVPNNALLVMVGKLPARADTMKLISDRFGSWEQKTPPEIKPVAIPKAAKKLLLVDRPGSEYAEVLMGTIAAARRDPEYFAQLAATSIAGGALTESDEAGVLSISAQVRNEAVGETIQGMSERLDRLATAPVTAQQLEDAKSSAAGSFLLRLEPQAGLADNLMESWMEGLPADYLETWLPRLESLTPDRIQAAAKRSMSSRDSVVVVVGDAAKAPDIGKFEVVKSGR